MTRPHLSKPLKHNIMKRKSYYEKVNALLREAKAETIAIMKEKGVREVKLDRDIVSVISENEEGVLTEYPVTKVYIDEGVNGCDVLYWDYDGPSEWHNNPLLWIEIHRAVFYHFGLYTKRYKGW